MRLNMRALEEDKKVVASVSGIELSCTISAGQELIVWEDQSGIVVVDLNTPQEEQEDFPVIEELQTDADETVTVDNMPELGVLPDGEISLPEETADGSAVFDEEQLFDKLATLRKQLSAEQGVPSYIIFTNQTLREIAQKLPLDLKAFRTINGVGSAKLHKYGSLFLEVIHSYMEHQVA